ncbi:MAG: hypothetical protein Q9213_007078 [Squamulea squamosa]
MDKSLGHPADAGVSLYKLLWEQYTSNEKNKNCWGQRFLCLETVQRHLDKESIALWTKEHPLYRGAQQRYDHAHLIDVILTEARLLFAMLVLGELEHLLSTLVYHGLSDATLFISTSFDGACNSAEVTEREREDLAKCRQRIGVILHSNKHEVFSQDTVLPYRNVNHPKDDRFGGFGVVQEMEIAPGHLRGYQEVG